MRTKLDFEQMIIEASEEAARLHSERLAIQKTIPKGKLQNAAVGKVNRKIKKITDEVKHYRHVILVIESTPADVIVKQRNELLIKLTTIESRVNPSYENRDLKNTEVKKEYQAEMKAYGYDKLKKQYRTLRAILM